MIVVATAVGAQREPWSALPKKSSKFVWEHQHFAPDGCRDASSAQVRACTHSTSSSNSNSRHRSCSGTCNRSVEVIIAVMVLIIMVVVAVAVILFVVEPAAVAPSED